MDLLDQGVTIFDADLRLVFWNTTFLRLLDFPASLAYVGAPFESFIRYNAERGEYGPGDVEAQVAERVAAARSFSTHETERRRPDGMLLKVRGEPLPHKGFVALYSDITEQRFAENLVQHQNLGLEEQVRRRTAQLENANAILSRVSAENARNAAALQRSEARVRLVLDSIPALIGFFDRHRVYQYANRGYSNWFNIPGDAIVGSAIASVVGHQLYEDVRPYIDQALSGARVSYEYTTERQGRAVHARSTLVPEFGPDGETLGCFVFSYDITEQKRLQAALVQAQKMEAIGQLTGGLAHDFNNLLTVMIGNLAALEAREVPDPEITEYVGPAMSAARRGVQLIKRLLSFSRQQSLEPQTVDIADLVSGMLELIRRSLPESIVTDTDLAAHPLYVRVDPGQFENALLNFALNARDAMPEGGRLSLSTRHVMVDDMTAELFGVAAGEYARLVVTDTGFGMDEATLARVFEPFFTTKRVGLGSGLGLSMVYGFVHQSGGGLRLRSAPGEGTVVTMLLPAVPAPADVLAADEVAPIPGAATRPLVLLVEDDADVRRVVRLQLTQLGYPVVEAENGVQALEMLLHVEDIGIVLSDLMMPGGVTGRDLAQHVQEVRPGTPVVLMSGYADDALGDLAGVPVLQKPLTTTALQDILKALHSAA